MFDIDKILFMRNTGKILPDAKIEDILFAKKLRSAMEKFVTIVGNPLNFTTRKAQLAKSTKISMKPIQEGSGDPSPSNIRPITGRTGVTLNGCGKNLWNGIVYQADSYLDTTTGLPVSNSNYDVYRIDNIIPNNSYTISLVNTNTETTQKSFRVSQFDGNGGLIGTVMQVVYRNESSVSGTVSIDENTKYILIGQRKSATNIQTEQSTVPTTYEPYQQSNEITISFGETVYGGTLDVEMGELTVTHKTDIMNGSDYDWRTADGGRLMVLSGFFDIGDPSYAVSNQYIKAQNRSTTQGMRNNPDFSFCSRAAEGYDTNLYLKDSRYLDDLAGFKAWLDANPLIIVQLLATPITVSLTPQQVQLLKGVNNLWTDGDSIELTYKA